MLRVDDNLPGFSMPGGNWLIESYASLQIKCSLTFAGKISVCHFSGTTAVGASARWYGVISLLAGFPQYFLQR